jgi:WD40 repeat protein
MPDNTVQRRRRSASWDDQFGTHTVAVGDMTVRLWDSATGQSVGPSLTGHTKEVNAVAFSPDGHLLASSSDGGTMRLWEQRTVACVLVAATVHVNPHAFDPTRARTGKLGPGHRRITDVPARHRPRVPSRSDAYGDCSRRTLYFPLA